MSSRSDGFFPQAETMTPYEKGYQQGREDAIAFFKSLVIRNDEDYDKPTISMKYLNDYIEQMVVDGFGADKGAEMIKCGGPCQRST